MNESRLEPYREEIMTMKTQGLSKANMLRQVEQAHGVRIGKSQFYAFVDQLTNGTAHEPEGGLFMSSTSQPLHSPADEETRALQSALLMKFDEVRQQLANVITWQSQLDEKEERREQRTREALQQFQQMTGNAFQRFQQALDEAIRQMEASRVTARPQEVPRPAANPSVTSAFRTARQSIPSFTLTSPRSWKHALLYSGILWGVVVALFVYGYWRPLWAALMGLIGFSQGSTLHT